MLEGDPRDGAMPSDEVTERLVGLVEEVSAEAKRIRAIAERLERLLAGVHLRLDPSNGWTELGAETRSTLAPRSGTLFP
jgi:hypothetical protein